MNKVAADTLLDQIAPRACVPAVVSRPVSLAR